MPEESEADRPPSPYRLTWAEVEPRGRDFDPFTVPEVAVGLVAAAAIPSQDEDRGLEDRWVDGVTDGLVSRYGRWAAGWHWNSGEGDLDGGPIEAWCCFHHSISTPEATAIKIAAALIEWHDWLIELDARFARFLPLAADDLDGWERAVAHLVTAVAERTNCESGWYGCCSVVLAWLLEAAGIEPASRREALVDHATNGRFDSWVGPPSEVVTSVAEDLAARVAGDGA